MMTIDEKECFAYKNRKCSVLRINKCEGHGCGFYKTNEQLQMERQKSLQRIQSLGEPAIKNINETYFNGKMNELVMEPN